MAEELRELLDYYGLLQEQMLHQKRTIDAVIGSEQRYTRGILCEEAVREFLRKMLPSNVAVSQGFLYSSGAKSQQCDVLLYDAGRYAPLLAVNDLVVLPIEAAVAVIEIKTFLDKQQLNKALQCFRSIDDICATALGYFPVKKYILAYDSNSLKAIRSNTLNTSSGQLDAIFVLEKGFLLRQHQAPNALEAYQSKDVLFSLLAHILNQYYFSTGMVGATRNPYEKYIDAVGMEKIE